MAHPPAQPRGSSPVGPSPYNRPIGSMGAHPGPQPLPEQPQPPQLPPENVYPCGCAFPGKHKQDCMWSLWEQMRDNYLQTKELMGKFMTQANMLQEAAREGVKCECPAGCHGSDLGAAMGLQQMKGVTVPWNMDYGGSRRGGEVAPQSYSVENEARKLMEEQKRIKNTWVQFLNIFDMALDMANDVSKDRWEQNRRRKERQRLEREQRLEEIRKERLERQKGSKPEPPPEKEKTPDKKEDKEKNHTEQTKEEKPKTPAEATGEEEQTKGEPSNELAAEQSPTEEQEPAASDAQPEEEGET